MRSNQAKLSSNLFHNKSKKIVEYANLITNFESYKSKQTIQKKETSKHAQKAHQSRQLSSNGNKNQSKKYLNQHIKSTKQFKKHNRSKTQCFKLPNQNQPQDFFQDQLMIPKMQISKKLKKQLKRLKTQSCKRIATMTESRSGSIKTKQSKQVLKNSEKSKGQQRKNQAKYISTLNDGLSSLKQKFQKYKSNCSGSNKNPYAKNPRQASEKSKDSKNATFLNLSQILHRNDCNEEKLFKKEKSNSSKKMRLNLNEKYTNPINQQKQQIQKIYSNLNQRITYITQSVTDQIQQKSCAKEQFQTNHHELGMRSFSFIDHLNPNIKKAKSNFSTGVDSVGVDYEIKQLLRAKCATQIQVNQEITKDLQRIDDIYRSIDCQADLFDSKRNISDEAKNKSSARTFREIEKESHANNNDKQALNQRVQLLNLVKKYHSMTSTILPLIYEIPDINSFRQIRGVKNTQSQFRQKSILTINQRQNSQIVQHNQKFMAKYDELVQKNLKYQKIINSLIQNGIDVDKYMNECLKNKK